MRLLIERQRCDANANGKTRSLEHAAPVVSTGARGVRVIALDLCFYRNNKAHYIQYRGYTP